MNQEELSFKTMISNIRSELKSYLIDNRLKSLVLGISGGIDSTLVALLAKPVCDELNIPLIGRSLPAKSNTKGENFRALEIGKLLCTDFKEVPITKFIKWDMMFDNFNVYPKPDDHKDLIRQGNIKARMRMILLYDLAQAENGLVLSTDNYTELMLGFWTLHGDVGDYGMIQNLWKTEVYDMAQWITTHELEDMWDQLEVISVINADATDGLGISKTDLDQILPDWEGSSRDGYAEVDRRLKAYLETGIGDLDDPVIQRYHRTEFKRNNPYNIPRNRIL